MTEPDPPKPAAAASPRRRQALPGAAALALAAGASWALAQGTDAQATWRAQVEATERAFAHSMAARDHAAFRAMLAPQAQFFGPGGQVLRGRDEVAQGWRRFFEGPQAPFSWEPDQVEVLDDGSLAWSTGPVRDPSGRVVARFNSVWRQVEPGVWRIVFDKGQPPDPPPR